jgi:hypothetical protein
MRAWLAIALAGAVVCTVCDHLHVINDVLSYPNIAFWGEAWWVPLLFATASLVIVANAGVIRRALGGAPLDPPSLAQVMADGIVFVTAYAFTAYGHTLPNVVLGVLLGFWLARALTAPIWLIVYSVLVAIGGTAFEGTWSKLGFFQYLHPDFYGVPRWLPGIYLHVAFLTAGLERLARGGDAAARTA